jgi:hypothetical protein
MGQRIGADNLSMNPDFVDLLRALRDADARFLGLAPFGGASSFGAPHGARAVSATSRFVAGPPIFVRCDAAAQ